MSASVATPMAGLLNYDFDPSDMPDFTATDFTDHMELDRSADLDNDNNNHHDQYPPNTQMRHDTQASNNPASSEEQKEALGNLLGALIPKQNEQSGDGSNISPVKNESFVAQEQVQSNDQAEYDHSRLPSFDATAANEIFSAEDFSNLDQNLNIPHTPIEQNMHDIGVGHFRQDSFASQGSIARQPATPQQREFEAFARLQFEDGSYYLNTYACELGRDVLAYRTALQKEREEKEAELNGTGKSRSSSGRASHPSGRIRRQLGSQMQGSVVSEQGGFAGIDEAPMGPPKNPEKPTMSSQESESSVVKPAEYLINPRTMPSFDYHRSTELQAQWTAQEEKDGEAPDDEQPAAVTAAHLPNPHMCPLIPIHGKPKDGQTDAELHKKISRRHVKIQWSFEHDCWEMKVQGRNGAFCDDKFVGWRGIVPLHDGAVIQIAHVVLTFRLPKPPQPQQEQVQTQMDVDADEALPSVEARLSESVAGGDERRESIAEQKSAPKISLKIHQKTEATSPEMPLVGADGQPVVKRRGPGRPPKDGIMSTRERKEREKAAKLAAARDANGGRTPPPSMRAKLSKPTPPAIEEVKVEIKPEKRKYTKRKATDENGIPMFDEEGEEEGDGVDDGEPKGKRARAQREKSESPEYPPKESLTAEQLARPPESYAQLLYKILTELYPRALPLKDIYRELKRRYPWYVYETQTEGWQSSVRHNLNSEFGKLFDKGDKEGKGFAWRAIPNAQLPQTEKKRTTQPTPQRPRAPSQRPQFQSLPGQNVQWQGTGAFPANGGQQSFINHGPWPPQGQPNPSWQQNGTLPAGAQQPPLPTTATGVSQQRSVSQTTTPGPPQLQGQTQAGQAPNGGSLPTPTAPAPVASSSSSLPGNMPCSLGGIAAIKRFEQEMYRQLGVEEGPPEKRQFWYEVFSSAKKRVLHGYPRSTNSKGDGKEEATIMVHMQSFVDRFRNPNFKGFPARAIQPSNNDEAGFQAQAPTPSQVPPPTASPASVVPSAAVTTPAGSVAAEETEPSTADPIATVEAGLTSTAAQSTTVSQAAPSAVIPPTVEPAEPTVKEADALSPSH